MLKAGKSQYLQNIADRLIDEIKTSSAAKGEWSGLARARTILNFADYIEHKQQTRIVA